MIEDQRTGERHDYTRRSGVESVQWFAPENAPQMTSAELWNMAEAAEKRKDSVVAREVLVAIPHELNQEQRADLVKRVSQNLADRYGVAGTAAIHQPDRDGDQRNWHAHILMTTRQLDPATGQLGAKTKVLDNRMTTGPEEVKWIRQMVEQEGNAALVRAGHEARLDSRSLADQGIDREPTIHEGPRITQIRRECERELRDPLGQCEVIELNNHRREIKALQEQSQQLTAEIIQLEAFRPSSGSSKPAKPEKPQALVDAEKRLEAMKREREELSRSAADWRQDHPIRAFFGADGPAKELEQAAQQRAWDAAKLAREIEDYRQQLWQKNQTFSPSADVMRQLAEHEAKKQEAAQEALRERLEQEIRQQQAQAEQVQETAPKRSNGPSLR